MPHPDPTAHDALLHIRCHDCPHKRAEPCRRCRRGDPRENALKIIETIEKDL